MAATAGFARRAALWGLFHGARPIGVVIPPSLLHAAAWPAVAAATLLELAYKGPTFADFRRLPSTLRPVPGGLRGGLALWRQRTGLHMAKLAIFWADRMTAPRWSPRGRFVGPEASLAAVTAGTKPVVLLTIHFGPFDMFYYWLRARGVPVAALALIDDSQRPWHRRQMHGLVDRAAGLQGVPRAFTPGRLWEAVEFLRGDRVLIVLATGAAGRHLDVDADGACLPLSTGALRIASMVGAVVIPCVASAGPGGVTVFALDDAVPEAVVSDRRRHRAACERLLRFCLPAIRSSPGQSDLWLLHRLGLRGDADGAPGVS